MGYTTNFNGQFQLDRPLTEAHRVYIEKFSGTRRMRRNEFETAKRSDPTREAVGLPAGPEGCYFVGEGGVAGQGDGGWTSRPLDVVDFNSPPRGQPGLWCQWVPTEDGTGIEWDGGEKFYSYVEWIQYIVKHFLQPWGYTLNGSVQWSGEEVGDVGVIVVNNNVVTAKSIEEERQEAEDYSQTLEKSLQEILSLQKNPIRRSQHNQQPGYKAPDWIQTKDRIFEIAKRALESK